MFLVAFASALVALSAAQTCSSSDNLPCISAAVSSDLTIYYCPSGMACLQNTTCCEYANIVTGTVTTTTTTTTAATSTCVDKINPQTGVSDCPKNANLCNYAPYYQLMTEQCPKTCNRCSGSSGSSATTTASSASTCVDKLNPSTGVSDCPKNANLCQNSAYLSLMKDQCPKTCGYC
ncbi:unnamed protein product [Caenorhabditis angaria]|uniref:ShKT domain-containing protein n=1 Tax=Caenorhabditis angaria TaxID=860376 RepID=A0A9P1ISN6_9PELO|nr:unnamed protein product [Caenorhabditis angaria]